MAEPPQTDVSRPSALPTAKLLRRPAPNQALVDQNSEEYLNAIEEEWNKKVDAEIEILVDGMVDIVSLASVSLTLSLWNEYDTGSSLDWGQGQVPHHTRGIPGGDACRVNGRTPFLFYFLSFNSAHSGPRSELASVYHALAEIASTPLGRIPDRAMARPRNQTGQTGKERGTAEGGSAPG